MTNRSWQRNLYIIFFTEVIMQIGMSFVNPFMPLLVQELGNFNSSRETALWAGIVTGVSGIAMFLSAPLWGILADRSGRKPMLLRSIFGTAIVVSLTAFASNIYYLVALRFANGLLSGIKPAIYALVSTTTPREKLPWAMGLISLGTFIGTTLGPLIGGYLADKIGFRYTFLTTVAILIICGLVVIFFAWEKFERPAQVQAFSLHRIWGLAISRQMVPILVVEFALQASPQMVSPIIPLVIKDLDPIGKAAATQTGLALGLMGVTAGIAAFVTGRLGGNISLKKILVVSCLAGALLYLPPLWAVTVAQLIIFVALTGVPKGGLITSASAVVGLSVSQSQQGIGYGIAHSAKSLGNGVGPLLGGSLGRLIGLKPVFGVAGGLFAIASVLVARQLTDEPPKKPQHTW